MDKKTVFVKTAKGESEANGLSDALYGDAKRILLLVDDRSTVGDISKRAAPSLRDTLFDMLQQLVDGGYVRDMRAPVNVAQNQTLKMATPAIKTVTPKAETHAAETQHPVAATSPIVPSSDIQQDKSAQDDQNSDLDFSFMTSSASQSEATVVAVNAAAQAEAAANANQEAERLKVEQLARIEAAAREVKLKAYAEAKEKAKIEVAARARIEAEARAKNEAEAARLKAEQDALQTRRELEATQARVEAEVRARIEAEAKAKQEVEAARLKAEREAEKIRLELEAAKVKAETELKKRLEAEARAKAEVEERVKREAEAERLRIEKERAELEVARVKAEAEIRLREEAERRVKAEVEERLKREAEAERLRIEKERAELEVARVRAEAEVRVHEEAERRAKAEVEEQLKREAEAERLRIEKDRAELEIARLKIETEQRMRAEAEIRIRAEVEARLKAETLNQLEDRNISTQDALSGAGLNEALSEEEQLDPAEKLRQSFVESFGQAKGKQKNGSFNFKLDTFSLNGSAQKKGAIEYPIKPKVLPGGGSKVKAAIEQRAKKEAEAERIKAEQELARLKSEHEQAAVIKSEEEQAAHINAALEQEQAKKAAEAQKLSAQQAKQWEEAQRRAANQAQAEKEHLARQSADAQKKLLQKSARVARQPLPIGKIVASLFVLMLLAVAALPYIWPLDEYIAPLEKEISAQLHQPVHIKKIHFALLPLPKLELHDLAVGSGQELKVGDVVLSFDFSALFAHTKSINSVQLSNVVLTGSSLDKTLGWVQTAGANDKYPVARMEFRGIQVTSDEIKLPLLDGRADFDTQGKLTKADLKSEDGKFALEFNSLQNRLQMELNIHESSLPLLPNIKFNDLSVNGAVSNGEIIFSDLFAHLHGGTLTGKGQLNWSNGWKLQAQINAKSLEMQSMFPKFGVSGELYGDVNVSMYGSALSQLDKDPRIEGTFEAKNGVVNKLDIDTIARFGTRQGGTGRTNFSELIGTFKADQRGQRFNLNKIAAGAASGNGLFDVDAKQQLSGKLLVDVKGDAKGNVPLQLSGSLTEPLLQPGR